MQTQCSLLHGWTGCEVSTSTWRLAAQPEEQQLHRLAGLALNESRVRDLSGEASSQQPAASAVNGVNNAALWRHLLEQGAQ